MLKPAYIWGIKVLGMIAYLRKSSSSFLHQLSSAIALSFASAHRDAQQLKKFLLLFLSLSLLLQSLTESSIQSSKKNAKRKLELSNRGFQLKASLNCTQFQAKPDSNALVIAAVKWHTDGSRPNRQSYFEVTSFTLGLFCPYSFHDDSLKALHFFIV